MATSVKMREEDKRRLDRLQGELLAMRGRKVSQQDLLSWLLTIGEREPGRLGENAARPMTDLEIAAMMRLRVRAGGKGGEEDIDDDIAREIR